VISPQLQKTPRESADKPFTFEMLRDQGNQVARKFGLVYTLPEDLRQVYLKLGIDLAQANGDDSWTLPMPGRFVIDRTGTIRAADADPDYTRRPDPARTIDALRALRG
jgi:peroxiredoxin